SAKRRLMELGHKRAGCVLGRWEASRARLVTEAFADYPTAVSFVEPGPPAEAAQVAGLVKSMMLAPERPSVIFTNQAYMAHLLPVLGEMQFAVPDEVSLVCFGDSPWLKALSPSVSAIKSDIEEMGWLSGTLMLRALSSGDKPPDYSAIHPAEWIERDS